ncbi:daptomycin-sensing surface protein LiaX [Enterococcus saccharolyticus]|uniref:Adhesin domain-containing protein n=1 Tax=Candidatus Enterococcus willemsii TaxID=1857215 RepID=A0ABQ6Z2D8_9ENTE|nr:MULTISPECIES: daptomycin-sensing surface protein LiaX [Enterococcus]KAF1305500.1 hypothetical protein BAU17_07375 [Enterococcus sp. CU12B]MCD5002742.1 daptomycin-sensing surface protein LiaX [Enterococcus saccharolyticus]
MNERERILDLVKKGVLSTEEALDLLEGIAKAKDESQNQKVADEVTAEKQDRNQWIDDIENFNIEEDLSDGEDALHQKEAEDREQLEKILDALATEANQASAELDEVNAEIQGIHVELKEAQESLMELNTKEELGEVLEEDLASRQTIEAEIQDLEASLDELMEERIALEAKLKNIRRNQWDKKKEKISKKIDLPDDWKEQATDTLNQVGGKVAEASTHLGKFLKKTFQSVSETVGDNVEWKDVSLRVPGVATQKFEKTFEFAETQASILDVRVANGNVQFNTWDEPGVKVEAKIKLYGKMDAVSPEAAFDERSQIQVDDEHMSFQIPNKRVRADLVFYLPNRVYDHVSVKLLNGNVLVNELEVKDIYAKSTNGNIQIEQINASMLEIEGVNGNITVAAGEILDSIIETVNGTVTMTATPQNIGISLVNGDVRLTLQEAHLRRLNATSVNGNVKVALPETLGLEGTAKTSLGSINSRLSEYEIVRQKKERMNQLLQFRRLSENIAQIDLSTTTGNIYLKDSEK